MKESVFSVRGLNIALKQDSKEIPIVSDLSFSLDRGKCLGIIGESGCGKSISCLAMIGILDQRRWKTTGSILLHGQELPFQDRDAMRLYRGTKIAMIMQDPMSAFDPLFTIEDHFIETAKAHSNKKHADIRIEAYSLLEKMRIRDPKRVLNSYPFECSGGMLQRIMIAISVMLGPDILIADEPTTALDQTVQYEIIKILKELKSTGTSIIFISHDIKIVCSIADDIAVMYGGYFVEKLPAAQLNNKARHPYTTGLMASRPSFSKKRLQVLDGVPPELTERASGCPFYPRCSIRENECKHSSMRNYSVAPNHKIRCDKLAGGVK